MKSEHAQASASATSSPNSGLVVKGAGKKYGDIEVLSDVNLTVKPGEVVSLLGENGAGKSTLSSIIAGVIQPSSGEMTWQGKTYSPSSPADALDSGIGLIHQEIRLLPDLSIAENVFLGRTIVHNGLVNQDAMVESASIQLERLGLDVSANMLVKDLKVAAQQQVEIAKALTLNAKLLILDEPTAALGGEETERLFEQIRHLKAEGVSFIYISHRLEEIAQIADRIVVLRDGSQVANHDHADVTVKQLVSEMVGRSIDRVFPERIHQIGSPIIEVQDLSSATDEFQDINFSVNKGEIFGIAGIVGAGRTELVRAISGADPIQSGTLLLDGKPTAISTPKDAIDKGIVLVPEDRKIQGIILEDSICDNVAYGNFDQFSSTGWVNPKDMADFAQETIDKMGVKGQIHQRVSDLSGGNQQKVIIAKWIARNPKVFILDEPTRGIDVGARAAIYDVISELAQKGMAVIIVSSDLDEVLGLSDRIMVLAHGEQQGILEAKDASQVAVMALATQ